jgi:hypothetical protein
MDPDQKRYVQESANDAWIRIIAFLKRHLMATSSAGAA